MTTPLQEPLWRDEFSVHKGRDHYVQRRQFTKFLVLTSLGMFVGNLWIWVRSIMPFGRVATQKAIGRLNDVPMGGVKLFTYPTANDPCILVRTGADAWVAYSQKCTHLACMVYYDPPHQQFACPCHEGFFAVADGRVLHGPPQRPLPKIVIERRGDVLVATGIDLGAGRPA